MFANMGDVVSAESPRTIGPYRILGVLAQGGMGIVYRGRHLQTDDLAAVKTVRVASEVMLSSIRREIHALSRVRHPGVVRIMEQGAAGGVPWYAMELLRGQTLRDHMASTWLRHAQGAITDTSAVAGVATLSMAETASTEAALAREPIVRIVLQTAVPAPAPPLTLLRRMCAPLAYLHGTGIVHRDLKPENVFIREDGLPVLVDLGIAAESGGASGREVLQVSGKLMGSVSYMSPEQIRGEFVDARSDLYSLGCILYECITGRAPFESPNLHDVLRSHLYHPPTPPSIRVTGVAPELDRLVLKLLEKKPGDRIGYADDVAAALMALGADASDDGGLPEAQPYLYRPEFSGRLDALESLGKALDRAERGAPGLVFIGGESGVGKTRLAMEVARSATRSGFTVIAGECAALGAGAVKAAPLHPFRPFLLAVADHCRESGPEAAVRLLGPRIDVLGGYEPALVDIPGLGAQPPALALPAPAARARLLRYLEETLGAFAEDRPLLLVLDDLQWADELSLALLQHLTTATGAGIGGRRVLVVCTYRANEMDSVLRDLVRAEGATNLDLGRLDASSVGQMMSGMLALATPPQALVNFVAAQSNGNPFFIAEYLRAAITEGLLFRDRTGAWILEATTETDEAIGAALPLPRTLVDLIEKRLLDLDERGLLVAQWAAVLGREIDGELLTDVAGLGDAAAMDAIAMLRTRAILEESGSGRLRFTHDKLREVIYERIAADQRRALHRRAAEAIEQRWSDAPDFPLLYGGLGQHWSRAEAPAKASRYLARAAARARAAYSNHEAITFYRAAIDEVEKLLAAAAPPDAEWLESSARLREDLGDMLTVVGRHEEARAAHGEALARIPDGDAQAPLPIRIWRARLHRKLGKSWETHHGHARALGAYAQAEGVLGAAPGGDAPAAAPETSIDGAQDPVGAFWQEWVQIQVERAWIHYFLSQVDEMVELVEKVRPVAERRGTPRQRAQFFRAVTNMRLRRERYMVSDETVAAARTSLQASDVSGDPSDMALSRFVLGFQLLFHGDFAEAEQQLSIGLEASERLGDVTLQARCLAYLMMAHQRQGRPAEARRAAERTLTIATAAKMLDYVGAATATQAWIAFREGDTARAAQGWEEALTVWTQLAPSYPYPFLWTARLPLFSLALDGGRVDEAVEHARAVLAPTQQRFPDELTDELARSVNTWKQGDAEATREALERARVAARALGYL